MATPTHYFLNEAAEYARVSVATLRRAISDGSLKAVKKAGRWRIKETELDRWLETSDHSPKTTASAARPAPATPANVKPAVGNIVYPWDRIAPAKRS